ncbi:MAG: ATP-binding protein [Spirochaetales bacterium]|nr:ATP-binding protein [Spirochaetales bacterium]
MKAAILSGKGGTGKTTVSTHLAALFPDALYVDMDVEEPNGDLFLNPEWNDRIPVSVIYPEIDNDKCTHCRNCAAFCRFNALIAGKALTISMKEICHGCGGCALVCPSDAIRYRERIIGYVSRGITRFGSPIISGKMDVGEFSGVPLIDRIRTMDRTEALQIIDSPPGTSCTTVAAVEGCDLAVIVTEPTPFALSDMKRTVEMLRTMKLPFAVVINKAGMGDRGVYDYCRDESIDILGEIPFSLELAGAYATGVMLDSVSPQLQKEYRKIMDGMKRKAGMPGVAV